MTSKQPDNLPPVIGETPEPLQSLAETIQALRETFDAVLAVKNEWESELLGVFGALGRYPTVGYAGAGEAVKAALQQMTEEREVRQILWANHGCPFTSLYGDDGELQCNALDCRLDFKREPLPILLTKLFAAGRLHAGSLEPLTTRADQAEAERDRLREENEKLKRQTCCHRTTTAAVDRAEAAEAREARLREYVQHRHWCWLLFKTLDLVPSGDGIRFRQPTDGEPVCTCGLDALLSGEGETPN